MARGRQMGRLKLRVPPKGLRERYLYEWAAKELVFNTGDFPELTSSELFGREGPMEVEIGPGTGEFLCALAAERPEVDFLGIEASRKAVYYAVHLAAEEELENIRFIHANVKLLYDLFPEAAWERIYLHFPDPVHKVKDEKHRIFDEEFLDQAYGALVPGGEISVVSDNQSFFREMLALGEADTRFRKAHAERYLEGFEPEAKSRFQEAWERKGVVPLHFILQKQA